MRPWRARARGLWASSSRSRTRKPSHGVAVLRQSAGFSSSSPDRWRAATPGPGHVAPRKAHFEKQHRIIADLERNRHDTADAKDLLSTLLQTQESHERDLQRILEELPK